MFKPLLSKKNLFFSVSLLKVQPSDRYGLVCFWLGLQLEGKDFPKPKTKRNPQLGAPHDSSEIPIATAPECMWC